MSLGDAAAAADERAGGRPDERAGGRPDERAGRSSESSRAWPALALLDRAYRGQRIYRSTPNGSEPLDVSAWLDDAAGADDILLSRCQGPVLDVGCGPGRLVAELNARGIVALGVDVSRQAFALSAARGACVLRRNVAERLPLEGRWGTIILADGNIGIGGDVDRLLARCHSLLRPGGLLIVDADCEDVDVRDHVVFHDDAGHVSHPVAWSRIGARGLNRHAARCGFCETEVWFAGHRRTIVVLRA